MKCIARMLGLMLVIGLSLGAVEDDCASALTFEAFTAKIMALDEVSDADLLAECKDQKVSWVLTVDGIENARDRAFFFAECKMKGGGLTFPWMSVVIDRKIMSQEQAAAIKVGDRLRLEGCVDALGTVTAERGNVMLRHRLARLTVSACEVLAE